MAMAMVRRRIAGYAKVKKKKVPLPKRTDGPANAVPARVYAPSAAVGRAVAAKPWWHGLFKPLGLGTMALIGGAIAFFVMKAPSAPSYKASTVRPEYPRSVSLSPSRVVGAPAARRTGSEATGGGHVGGAEMVVLANRGPETAESFRAAAYVRQKVNAPAAKVQVPESSGTCVVTGSDIGECLRQHAR